MKISFISAIKENKKQPNRININEILQLLKEEIMYE